MITPLLTREELDILRLSQQYDNKQIAAILRLKKSHITSIWAGILEKLPGAKTETAAVCRAIALGLIPVDITIPDFSRR